MQWLISQMWILLAVAGVLGLILGLALRGLMSGNKMRRATVERDVARTELEQARAEIDALYASQRKMKEDGVVSVDTSELDALRHEISKRDEQITDLQMSLQSARDDAEAARNESSNRLETAGAAVAGAAAGALLGGADDGKVKELEERNTWLEERVAALEADLSAAPQVQAETAPTVAAPTVHTETEASPKLAKLEWQNTYLRQRVEALEGQMHIAPVATAPVEAANVEPEPEAAQDSAANDEELARLRWRNRYLEGRLAYYEEGGAEAVAEVETDTIEADDDDNNLIATATAGLAAVAATAVLSDTDEEVEAPEADAEETEDAEQAEQETELEIADEVEDADKDEPADESDDGDDETVTDLETDFSDDDEETVDEEVELEASDSDADEIEDDAEDTIEEEHPSDAVLRSLEESEDDDQDDAEDADVVEEADSDHEAEEETEEESAELEGIQPTAINAPFGGGDDLTQIGGIGPRISEVLNGLGIWTHAQIAEWTPENAAWIEEHLSFKGRVSREQWVEQAKVLVASASEASD